MIRFSSKPAESVKCMFTEIPSERPLTPLLDSVTNPADLRLLALNQLEQFNHELRAYLIYSVGQSGGHFGAGLGVVELTTALHYVFDTPHDKLVWDVGHQAYPHKIITGRREQMPMIRSKEGPAAFPLRSESEYDTFGVGHSSTSISAAMGMSLGMRAMGKDNQAVAIIGDGAMTAGMAFEALNHAGHEKADMLVILNDNDMAISDNVGALNKYFTRLWSSPTYSSFREGSKKILQKSATAWEFMRKTEEHMKAMVAPGILFEELGFNYYGPIDGHDTEELVHTLANLKKLPGPKFLHIVTKKGKGFAPAEAEQIKYHALKQQNVVTATVAKSTYSNVFGNWLCDMAEVDARLVGITPAMREGSDMIRFSELYPKRYFDVAIAEQHAVTLAAGMACEGTKPVVAIYSTFLQRGYDQLIHDVALQDLDVLFAIDRAGLVGEDGPTHHGAYDHSFLRCIPNMVVMAPSNKDECRQMLYTGYQYQGPAAVRYPRGTGIGTEPQAQMHLLALGKGIMRRQRDGTAGQTKSIAVLAFGSCVNTALEAADTLAQQGIDISVADMRFIKPLDGALITALSQSHDQLICIEESAIMGGAGSAVLEYLAQQHIATPCQLMGIADRYIEHASPVQQLADTQIDTDSLIKVIKTLS